MAVRGEELAGNLEAHVRESIDRLVGDIKSSIQDVREAVDSQLNAALQSIQADAKGINVKAYFETAIAGLESATPEPLPVAPAPAPIPADSSRLKRAVLAIERGKTQVDILNALLEQSLQFGSRAALMILKGDAFSGWKGVGFTAHGGNDEAIKRFSAQPGTLPELDQVLRQEQVVAWDGANFAAKLGVTAPGKALVVPMVIKDKVAAAVYVDLLGDSSGFFDRSAVEMLVFMTGLLIDTLAIRKKTPSPSLSADTGEGDYTAAAVPPPAPAPIAAPRVAAPAPSAPPRAEPPAPTPPPAAAAETTGTAARKASTPQFDMTFSKKPAPPAGADNNATFGMDEAALSFTPPSQNFRLENEAVPAAPKPAAPASSLLNTTAIPAMNEGAPAPARPAAPPPPPPPSVAKSPASPLSEGGEKPSTQFIPPPGIARGNALGGPQNDETRKHDEARRFARLLVSEIKLYNEAKVEQGRKNRDLYERLKEDIDRSRQMYDERITEDVRKRSNYFYDELVRILADADASALGL